MKNLVSIVVLFSLFHEGEMGRFSPPPSTVATECETVLLDNLGWACEGNVYADLKTGIIRRGKICDGVVDCPNGRDEKCTEDTNEYLCKSIHHTRHICDGVDQCLNRVDESSCFENKFSCDNGNVSLTSRHICDQMTDCADGTDETLFECHKPMAHLPVIECDRVIFPRLICTEYPLCLDRSDQSCIHEICGFMDCDQLTLFDFTASKCYCACRDGYIMDENSTCTEIDCGPPPPLSNGNISFTNGTKYESIATYMCNSEHELLGVSQRKCGLNGMWTGREPSCLHEDLTCKRPIDIQNGNITVSITPGGGFKKGTSEQQQAVYQCDDGYTLIGNSTRDCNKGHWDGLPPQCIKNATRCEVPSLDIDDGSISSPCQPGEGALEGTVLQYSCDPGYTLDGPQNVTCGKDSVWSALPSCKLSALDVIFAIDDSSSISGKQFRGLKTFLVNVVDSLNIGKDAVRIGVIKYARGVKDEIRLDDFFGKEMLKAAILKIKHERGGTRTGKAITRMVKAFQKGFGARVGAQKIGIVITDGKSKDSVTRPVMRAERAGITLYAVGVGGSVDRSEIRTIAGDRSRAFFSTSFSTLNRIIQELTTAFGG